MFHIYSKTFMVPKVRQKEYKANTVQIRSRSQLQKTLMYNQILSVLKKIQKMITSCFNQYFVF